jgi:hypothetical protein
MLFILLSSIKVIKAVKSHLFFCSKYKKKSQIKYLWDLTPPLVFQEKVNLKNKFKQTNKNEKIIEFSIFMFAIYNLVENISTL